jgi:hypothetical protein
MSDTTPVDQADDPDPLPFRPNDPYETGGVQAGFQLPHWMWQVMLGCYVIFFITVAAATGRDNGARLAIVISILYVVMFFGTVTLLHRQKGGEHGSPLDRNDGMLDTWTGKMDVSTVAAQILGVPIGMVFLGTAFLISRTLQGL